MGPLDGLGVRVAHEVEHARGPHVAAMRGAVDGHPIDRRARLGWYKRSKRIKKKKGRNTGKEVTSAG